MDSDRGAWVGVIACDSGDRRNVRDVRLACALQDCLQLGHAAARMLVTLSHSWNRNAGIGIVVDTCDAGCHRVGVRIGGETETEMWTDDGCAVSCLKARLVCLA